MGVSREGEREGAVEGSGAEEGQGVGVWESGRRQATLRGRPSTPLT